MSEFELHVVPVTDGRRAFDRYIVYRPRIPLAFVGNRAMADLATALSRDRGLTVPREARAFLDRIGFFASDPPMPSRDPSAFAPAAVVLLLTNDCQLRCTYCYAAAGAAEDATLDVAAGRVAIDYVHESARSLGLRRFEVDIHGGGEPTRAWDTLRALVEHARGLMLPVTVSVTSNAVWSRRHLDWMVDHVDRLTLSVDGAPKTHDAQRPFATGHRSSALVLRTLAELDVRGFPYTVRLTAAAPWQHLAENVRFLCERTTCGVIRVEPAFTTARESRSGPDPADCHAFARAYRVAMHVARRAGRVLAYSGAQVGAVVPSYCSAPYDGLVVTPQGNLVTCSEVSSNEHPFAGASTVGRIVDGIVAVDYGARRRLHDLLSVRREACRGCWCFRTCAGDCYVRASGTPSDGWHLTFGPRCAMNQEITRGTLLAGLTRDGGVWHGEPAVH